jgi:hypothetical protein
MNSNSFQSLVTGAIWRLVGHLYLKEAEAEPSRSYRPDMEGGGSGGGQGSSLIALGSSWETDFSRTLFHPQF